MAQAPQAAAAVVGEPPVDEAARFHAAAVPHPLWQAQAPTLHSALLAAFSQAEGPVAVRMASTGTGTADGLMVQEVWLVISGMLGHVVQAGMDSGLEVLPPPHHQRLSQACLMPSFMYLGQLVGRRRCSNSWHDIRCSCAPAAPVAPAAWACPGLWRLRQQQQRRLAVHSLPSSATAAGRAAGVAKMAMAAQVALSGPARMSHPCPCFLHRY